MSDDDGVFRKDLRMKEGVTDLSGYTLEEKLLPEGEVVTVMGVYSEIKGGITGDFRGTGTTVSLELGGGDEALKRFGRELSSRIVTGIVLIVLLLGGTFGVLEVLEREEGRSLLRPGNPSSGFP